MNVYVDNTTYVCWEEKIIEHFRNSGRWNKVVFDKNTSGMRTVDYYEKVVLKNLDKTMYAPPSIYDALYKNILTFLDMYARNGQLSQDLYSLKNLHDHLNIFNMLVNHFYTVFKTNEIDLFIIQRAPHLGIDYIKCLLAKEMNIKCLILEQSLFPNRFFYYWDLEDYGEFNTASQIYEKEDIKIEEKVEKDLFYVKPVKMPLKERLRTPFFYHRSLRNAFTKENILSTIYNYNMYRNYKKYKNYIVSSDVDFNAKYVYFAMHLQPEKTTSSWGGIYNDQILALERLSQLIPEDWYVYVKENPYQGSFMRGEWFYKRLSMIPKVKVVPNNTNTYKLTKGSQFVSTITGTVGWEAVSGGKNVVAFGWGTWYKTLPGCFMYSQDLDPETIADNVIDHHEVEKKLSELDAKMGRGAVVYEGYESIIPDFSFEKNVENLIDSFERIFDAAGI